MSYYKFKMQVNGQEKEIKIPEEDIKRTMKGLDCSIEEAIDIWLEDEGYVINDEQEALCKKAKDNKITATIHAAKSLEEKKPRERERKPAPRKEMIIAKLFEALKEIDGAQDIVVENIGKIITFRIKDEEFKLDLVQRRKKK